MLAHAHTHTHTHTHKYTNYKELSEKVTAYSIQTSGITSLMSLIV